MTPTPIPSASPPDLRELLDAVKQEILFSLNCHEVGRIVSFDVATQSASVQIMVLRIQGDKTVVYPLLTDCPVFIPSGGTGALTFPIAVGDPCLVLFNDRDIDNWFVSGNNVAPNSYRMHSLSDGLVIVGFRNKQNKLTGYSTTDTELKQGAAVVGLDETKISLRNAGTSLRAELDALFTHLNSLCTALTGWVNTGASTPNPATVLAINTVKASIAANKVTLDTLLK